MIAKEGILKFAYDHRQVIWAIMFDPFFTVRILFWTDSKIIRKRFFIYFMLFSDLLCCLSVLFIAIISAIFEDIGFWGIFVLFLSIIMAAFCVVNLFDLKFIFNPMKYSRVDVDRNIKILKNILEGIYLSSSLLLALFVAYNRMKFGDTMIIRYGYIVSVMIVFPRVCKYFFEIYSIHRIKGFLKE